MVKMGIFVVRFHDNIEIYRNFDHLTIAMLKFWPWSWA